MALEGVSCDTCQVPYVTSKWFSSLEFIYEYIDIKTDSEMNVAPLILSGGRRGGTSGGKKGDKRGSTRGSTRGGTKW